jgi:hypothetical protein
MNESELIYTASDLIESSIKQNSMNIDQDMNPGNGPKVVINCYKSGKKMINLVDTGSSTSLVTRKFVVNNKITTFKSKIPISFWGLLAASTDRRDIAILEYQINREKIFIPAYVIDELPSNIDVLLGTDQIGKQVGISMPLDNRPSISIRCGKEIITYELASKEDGTLYADIELHTDCKLNAFVEPGGSLVIDGKPAIGDETVHPVVIGSGEREQAKSKSSETKEFTKPKSDVQHTQREIDLLKADQGPPTIRSDETDARLIQLTCELRSLTHAIELVRNKIQELRKQIVISPNTRRKKTKRREEDKLLIKNVNQLELTLDQLLKDIESIKKKKMKHIRSKARGNRKLARRQMKLRVAKALQELPRTELKPNQSAEEIGIVRVIPIDSPESKSSLGVADWSGDFAKESTYVPYPLTTGESERIEALKAEFKDTILPKTETIPMGKANIDEEFDIELRDDQSMKKLAKKLRKPIPLKGEFRNLCKSTLDQMEKSGVGANNPRGFNPEISSPTFFAKNKAKYRMVHDYTELNDETKDIIYPMPRVEDILESLGGKTIFSILDLKSGYHQFRLTPRAEKLCAVITPFGIFQYTSLPMGLKNAPAFFQRVMDKVLKEGLGTYVFVYIDDIIVFSNNFDDHIIHLQNVLLALREANLKANIEKCHLCLSQLKILGKVISSEGIKTDPEMIEAMVNFPAPSSAKHVKSFLATCNYYREHIDHFAELTEPLARLARNDFIWKKDTWTSNPSYRECFDRLKIAMTKAPILAYPDLNRPFWLQTDASKVGAGAVLYQTDDAGMRHVVAYASWLFNAAQRNYDTTQRELLALILATRKWKPFLRRYSFVAETDHQALVGCMNIHDPHGKIARWTAELSQFSIDLRHIKGINNVISDTLSRLNDNDIQNILLFGIEFPKYGCRRLSKCFAKSFNEEILEMNVACECTSEQVFVNSLNYALPTDDEWLKEVIEDEYFGAMYEYILNNRLPPMKDGNDKLAEEILRTSHSYVIHKENKLLYHRSTDSKLALCTPLIFRKVVLGECHDSLWSGGHMGRDKTYDKVRDKYYFKNMSQYVDNWVATCNQCQSTKRASNIKSLPLGVIDAKFVNDIVSIDLWDAGCVSTSGQSYVLTVIDGFSKFAHAITIRNKEATTIAKHLMERVFTFGTPIRLHSDRGTEFVNSILEAICRLYGIKKTTTTAYHPQGNAYAERIHQFFRNALTAFIRRDQRDWDLLIPILVTVYNDSIHEALGGHSPAQVYLGRNLNPPIQILEVSNTTDYVNRIKLALDRVQKEVTEIAYRKMQENYRAHLNKDLPAYQVGDKVGVMVDYLPVGFTSAKLFPRWKGPYTITKTSQDGKVVYLKDPFDVIDKCPVSIMRIKPWFVRADYVEDLENQNEMEIEEIKSDEESSENTDMEFYTPPTKQVSQVVGGTVASDRTRRLTKKQKEDTQKAFEASKLNIMVIQQSSTTELLLLVEVPSLLSRTIRS